MLDCIHVCVFLLSKNCFEKLARHLLDTLLSVELLKPFSYRNPNSSSIPGGSIEKSPTSSIASRHLVDRLSLSSCVFALFLDSFICRRCFSQHLPWQMSRHLLINRDILAYISLYGSSFSSFPLCQFSICLCHVFWPFIPFDNHVKKWEKFKNWMSFLRGSNRFRGRTSY